MSNSTPNYHPALQSQRRRPRRQRQWERSLQEKTTQRKKDPLVDSRQPTFLLHWEFPSKSRRKGAKNETFSGEVRISSLNVAPPADTMEIAVLCSLCTKRAAQDFLQPGERAITPFVHRRSRQRIGQDSS